MKIHATANDDPGFVRLVSSMIDALVLQRAPEIVAIVAVDNWFDHKWLNFSGKVLGALGVWKDPLTIPPFHPDRIIAQTVYRLAQQKEYEQMEAPPLHIPQASSQNLKRKLGKITDSGIFVWWSGNTAANAKGSLMAYIQNGTDATSWYASFDRPDQWKINKTKNISTEEVRALLQSAEASSAPDGNTETAHSPSLGSAIERRRRGHA
ncbi:MAG: hypothetical protein JWR19_989 [Pedosphaera sp.]|nr:hypothetical protein [Pedosphaera sp.]